VEEPRHEGARPAPWPLRRAVIEGEHAGRDARERAELARAALAATRDGSRSSREAAALARRALPVDPSEWRTLADATQTLCCCDAYAEGDGALERWGERAQGAGVARRILGESRFRQGRLHDARAALAVALSLAGEGRVAVAGAAWLALCELELGELDRAAATLASAGSEPARDGAWETAYWLYARARVGAARGETAAALDDALECGRRLQARAGGNPAYATWRAVGAEYALRLGDRERARRLANQELVLARAFGASRALGIALRVSGLTARAAGERARLAESVEVLRGSGAQLELVRSLVELGAAQRRSGDRRDARGTLREALDLAERLGGARLAHRAGEELRASGARPRREALSGAASLTPSERRVAELAVAGLTNRDIAQELFVTVRTVTTHLTQVYRKLGIEGRGQIASALDVGGLAGPAGPQEPPVPAPAPGAAGPALGEPASDQMLLELSPDARSLASAVAILQCVAPEEPVHFSHAARIADLAPSHAERARAELTEARVLGAGVMLTLTDPRLAQALYDAIAPASRADAHGRAAQLLSDHPQGLRTAAAHLERTPPTGAGESLPVLRAAARAALADGAPETAIGFLRRALAEPPAPGELPAVMRDLGEAEAVVRDVAAESHLAAASEDPRTAALLVEVQSIGGRFAAAHRSATASARELGVEVDPALLAPLESIRACLALGGAAPRAELDRRMELLRTLSVAAGESGRALLVIEAFWSWQTMRPGGTSPLLLLDRSAQHARFFDSPEVDRELAGALALVQLVALDEVERAERVIDAMFSHAQRRGSTAGALIALGWSAHLALRVGEVGAAERDARAAVRLAQGRDAGAIAALCAAFHADALLERGAFDEAAAAVDPIDLRGAEDTALAAYVTFSRGRVRLAQGRREEAARELQACRAASAGLFVDNPNVLPSRSTLAIALAAERPQQARELAAEELRLARSLRQPRAIGVALHVDGLLAESSESLGDAIATLARSPARLSRARALGDLAALLTERGRPGDAEELLDEALAIALRCGATELADEIARRMAARPLAL
jgi:DNA-binding CsgD family transcriptional regulator